MYVSHDFYQFRELNTCMKTLFLHKTCKTESRLISEDVLMNILAVGVSRCSM